MTAHRKPRDDRRTASRSVFLLDDHPIVRIGLKTLIELDEGLKVVAECGDLQEALRLTQGNEPDLIITDLLLPGVVGAQGIAELRRQCPGSHIVVLSVSGDHERIRTALQAGANGYVLKDSSQQQLFEVIHGVLNGERRLCTKASEVMLRQILSGSPALTAQAEQVVSLSRREQRVVTLIASGASTKRIATELDLSAKTVEKHRYNAMRKLGLHNIAQVTRFVIDSGLLDPQGGGSTVRLAHPDDDTIP